MYQTDQQRRLAPAEFPPSPCEDERGAGRGEDERLAECRG